MEFHSSIISKFTEGIERKGRGNSESRGTTMNINPKHWFPISRNYWPGKGHDIIALSHTRNIPGIRGRSEGEGLG